MYNQHFGFSEAPFQLLPDPSFLYMSKDHGMALTLLRYSILNKQGFTAITGEVGSGKTTLISTLSLDALYGTPSGEVTLNGVPLTDKLFKRHCYVMKQHDKHWAYLTCRETLYFCAALYAVAERNELPLVVDEIIEKMGLGVCADTRCSRLSGGQQRRLSIGIALLKQVCMIFLRQ